MAADDLTGPPVLKLQSRDNLSGRRLEATPVSAGLPRNIGHGDAPEAALPASRLSAMPAGQIATSMVAATVRIPRVEWIGVMFYSLSPSSRKGRPGEGFSTGGNIQPGARPWQPNNTYTYYLVVSGQWSVVSREWSVAKAASCRAVQRAARPWSGEFIPPPATPA